MQPAVFEEIATPIGGVQAHDIPLVVDRVTPLLEKVLKTTAGHTVASVMRDLHNALTQLWIVGDFEGMVITHIQQRPTERVLWVEWMAGDTFTQWADDWYKVQAAFAQANDCTAIEFHGRRGYRKYEKSYPEFTAVATVYRQEL